MQEIVSKIKAIILQAAKDCKSDSLALSGGLDSSILASCIGNEKIRSFTLITKDFPSTDLVCAQLVAKANNMQLDVIMANTEELLSSIEQTIKILKVFNPIEIRNNIVIYLTMKTAKDLGYESIMTGDGADELFAGYNFFKRLSGKELDNDLKRIWNIMHYPSRPIAKLIGISLHTPFLDEKVIDYAKKIPSDLKIHDENGKKYGKWILRKAFESDLSGSIVWREKAAMQDGSGTSGLTSFFDTLISESMFLEKSKYYAEKEKVNLSSKESLYYYEIYRKYFDMPSVIGKKSESSCPNCGCTITKNSHFCRMCGSYPI